MVAADGGVFAFGDAKFAGSCPGLRRMFGCPRRRHRAIGHRPENVSLAARRGERSVVEGERHGWLRQSALGWVITPVPMARNSVACSPQMWLYTAARTPTIPSAPWWAASSSIRVMANSRAV